MDKLCTSTTNTRVLNYLDPQIYQKGIFDQLSLSCFFHPTNAESVPVQRWTMHFALGPYLQYELSHILRNNHPTLALANSFALAALHVVITRSNVQQSEYNHCFVSTRLPTVQHTNNNNS